MNTAELLLAARALALLAVLLMVIQWLWSHQRLLRQRNAWVRARLAKSADVGSESAGRVIASPLERVLVRAGIYWSRSRLTATGAFILVFLIMVAVVRDTITALVMAVLVVVFLYWYWRVRLQQQRRRIYEALPGIIDSCLRYIDAGRSLESALVEAFKDAPAVFDPLVFRLRSAVEAGREYTELFEDFAQLYNVADLVVVAIALRTSARFGSSIRPVLQQVGGSIRAQQELRREFLAATAEIRFTAGAFAVLPLGIAAYMILANEEYSRILLHTGTGHMMLMAAGIMQAVSITVLWKMIQGVGRG